MMRCGWPKLAIVSTLALFALAGCAPARIPPANPLTGIGKRTGLAVPPGPTSKEGANWPPGITPSGPMSSDDAAAIAIWNNKQLQADLASLGIARGDLIDAGLLKNPRLDMLPSVGTLPFDLLVNFPVEVFWQRRRRVAASEKAFELLATSLVQNGLNAVRDARLAHADLLLAHARQTAAQRAAGLRKRIAELTAARLRAGDISELDAMAAISDAAATEEQLTRMQREILVAEERLRFVLGLSTEGTTLAVSPSPIETAGLPVPSDLLEKAMGSRPDLKAAEIAVAAATKRAGWERSRISLAWAQLNSREAINNGILTRPGINAEIPIFHRNQGLIARADADVEVAARLYIALRQRVAFEVREARELLAQAQVGLERMRGDVLPALKRTADLARQQYEQGDVAYLFVLEQTRGLTDAELRLADSEAAVRRGLAQLERSVGSK